MSGLIVHLQQAGLITGKCVWEAMVLGVAFPDSLMVQLNHMPFLRVLIVFAHFYLIPTHPVNVIPHCLQFLLPWRFPSTSIWRCE